MTRKLIVILLLISTTAGAQFNFLYRQYVLNQMGLNPGYTGSREVFSLAYQYRYQWVGIKGAPITHTVAADAPMKGNKVALGFYGINEQIGNTNHYNFDINYAYRLQLGEGKLSLGLKTSANIFTQGTSDIISSNDRAFFGEKQTFFMPNFGAGAYYYDYNRFFVGFSVPSFLSYSGDSVNQVFTLSHNINNYNFLGSAGVLFRFGEEENYKLRLSSLVEYNIVTSVGFDVNAMLIVKDLVWVGGSYVWRGGSHHKTGIVAYMAQVQVNPQLRVGYSYDMGMGDLNYNSHEVMIRYEFSYKINAESPIF